MQKIHNDHSVKILNKGKVFVFNFLKAQQEKRLKRG